MVSLNALHPSAFSREVVNSSKSFSISFRNDSGNCKRFKVVKVLQGSGMACVGGKHYVSSARRGCMVKN